MAGAPRFAAAVSRARSIVSSSTHSGWAISSLHDHASFWRVTNTVGSSAHQSPSRGPTTKSRPSSRLLAALMA